MVRRYVDNLLEDELEADEEQEVAEEELESVEDEGLADSVRTYLTEMARTPLLTADDEVRLFRVIEAADYLKNLRAEIGATDWADPALARSLVATLEAGLALVAQGGKEYAPPAGATAADAIRHQPLADAINRMVDETLVKRLVRKTKFKQPEVEEMLLKLSITGYVLRPEIRRTLPGDAGLDLLDRLEEARKRREDKETG